MMKSKYINNLVIGSLVLFLSPLAKAEIDVERLLPNIPKIEDIRKSAHPNASVFDWQYIAPSQDGGFQFRQLSDKFVAVFFPDGRPAAIFDLTLNHMTIGEVLLGGFGIGEFTLGRLIKLVKKRKENQKNSDKDDAPAEDIDSIDQQAGATISGFSKLKFNSLWAQRRNVAMVDANKGIPFKHGNFRFSELMIPKGQKQGINITEFAYQPFLNIGRSLFPDKIWDESAAIGFMDQFEFRYDEKQNRYSVYWHPKGEREEKEEDPKLPGFVVNYLNPYANLQTKLIYFQVQQLAGSLAERLLGPYGKILDYILSRTSQNFIERIEYHERQLVGILESATYFRYDVDLPIELITPTIDALYLSEFTRPSDPFLAVGDAKRRRSRVEQEMGRLLTLETIAKRKQYDGLTIEEFGNGKFAALRENCDSVPCPITGIYGLAVPPIKFVKILSRHTHAKGPGFKIAERYLTDLAAFAARSLLPNGISFKVFEVTVGISIDPELKDFTIRERMWRETRIEGELVGMLEGQVQGRYDMPLSAQENADTQVFLRKTLINPFKLELEEEAAARSQNYDKLVNYFSNPTVNRSYLEDDLVLYSYKK